MAEILTADKVDHIFMDCLFKEEEETTGYVLAEGVMCSVGFNQDRLEQHKTEIEAMLAELPINFMKSGGGGWSFLNACYDKHGNQWTGLHEVMDQLFMLGQAIGKVGCLMPRFMWTALPGMMPYYIGKYYFI